MGSSQEIVRERLGNPTLFDLQPFSLLGGLFHPRNRLGRSLEQEIDPGPTGRVAGGTTRGPIKSAALATPPSGGQGEHQIFKREGLARTPRA